MKNKLKLLAVFAFALAALFLVLKAAVSNAQTQVVTAGQKFKSIKVLNDMPADQMGMVMNMMSASLGVDCKFCHASNDGDFEKEGFEHKDIARQMLKMTFDINKNFFEGRPEVTCNTCHRGAGHPQSAINLFAPAPEPRPAQPEKKPTIEEILARHAAAVGTADIKSRRIKATRLEPDGKTSEPEEIIQNGARLQIDTLYGAIRVTELFDGKKATKFTGAGPIEINAADAAQIKREAQIFGSADLKSVYAKLDFRFVDKIDGRDVYVVQATTAEGTRERLYFDAQTGFLVRRLASAPTVIGGFQYEFDYLDYKDFGGVRLPTTTRFAVPKIRFTRKLLEVKINAPID